MHLVDAHRLARGLALLARRQPVAVEPGVPGGEHDRRGGGRVLGRVRQRVSLLPPHRVPPEHLALVPGAVGHAGDEQFPYPGPAERAHRVGAAVPVVEVARDADAPGVRRPDGEGRTRGLAHLADVGPEHAPELFVAALRDQVQVELADGGQEAVRVVGQVLVRAARGIRGGDPVLRHLLVADGDGEDALVQVRHGEPAAVVEHERHRRGERAQGPDDDAIRDGVGPQDRVRVVVLPGGDLVDLAQAEVRICHVGCSICSHYISASDSRGILSQCGRFRAS